MGCCSSCWFLSELAALPHFHNSAEAIFRSAPDALWREFTSKHTSWLTTGQRHVSNVATRTNRKPQAAQFKKKKIWLCMWWTEGSFNQPPCFASPFANSFYGFFSRWVCKTNTADFWETLHLASQTRITTNCTPISWIPFAVENCITFEKENISHSWSQLVVMVTLLLYLEGLQQKSSIYY